MLTSLRIRQYKAWHDTGTMRLAPLTVVFGDHGTGKSSLGHGLRVLQQAALAHAPHPGDATAAAPTDTKGPTGAALTLTWDDTHGSAHQGCWHLPQAGHHSAHEAAALAASLDQPAREALATLTFICPWHTAPQVPPELALHEATQGLRHLGLAHALAWQPGPDARQAELRVQRHDGGPFLSLDDAGLGVSQVLPVLALALMPPTGRTAWLEHPETHLHPRAQAGLADVLIAALSQPTQFIVESHSEALLNRIQRRVAEGTLSPSQVALYVCRRPGHHAELEALRLNTWGDIENWPNDLFDHDMTDIAARTIAAMRRKAAQAKGPAT